MTHTPVVSSMIRSVGYDPASQTLEITFPTGVTYRYAGVPPEVAEAFLAAESKGKYFHAAIRAVYAAHVHTSTDAAARRRGMHTMAAIRAQYPHPRAMPEDAAEQRRAVYVEGAYDVGGALCRVAELPKQFDHFPPAHAVSSALSLLNPALSAALANSYARRILTNNDAGRFDAAWRDVDEALAGQHA
jgi:hypothetical protein